jgi:hypothetical protein
MHASRMNSPKIPGLSSASKPFFQVTVLLIILTAYKNLT